MRMSSIGIGYLVAVLLLVISVLATANELQDEVYPCTYSGDGVKLDLKSFDGQIIEGKKQGSTVIYLLTFCGNINTEPCNKKDSSLCSKPQFGDYVVQYASNTASRTPAPVVEVISTEESKGYALKYHNSEAKCTIGWDDPSVPYQVRMELLCAEEADPTFEIQTLTNICDLLLTYHHPKFCKSASSSSGGLSGGAIFLIIVFSVLAAYFIIGFLVCKFYLKKPGCKESIPQHAFWCALPGFFVAGVRCTFSFFAAKCCGKRGGASRGTSSDDYESYGAV